VTFSRAGCFIPRRLALVTQALLVAVRLHALFTFVFVDLRLTTLLERAHVCELVCLRLSVNDFIEGILDDPLSAQRLELRNDFPNHRFINDRFERDPFRISQAGDGG